MNDSEIAAIRAWLSRERHCHVPCACYRNPQRGDCQSSALSLAKAIEKARPAQTSDLLDALKAQVEVSTMHMVRAGFDERDILDCTAQARRAIELAEGSAQKPDMQTTAKPE
jgi:hypothetical protein